MRKKWTQKDIEYLVANYPTVNTALIAEKLNCTKLAVVQQANKNGVVKLKVWTPLKDRYLRIYYPNHDSQQLADKLGVSKNAMQMHANYLGVKKSLQFLQNEAKRLENNTSTRFKKGHVAWNKGKKMTLIASKKSWFKKGMVPHNTKYDGHQRVTKDGYIEERVQQGLYRLKHILVWEAHRGPYNGATHCLWFKDRNRLNCDIDNLELITRGESIRRTQQTDEFILSARMGVKDKSMQKLVKQKHPELIDLKRKQLQLQKRINTK